MKNNAEYMSLNEICLRVSCWPHYLSACVQERFDAFYTCKHEKKQAVILHLQKSEQPFQEGRWKMSFSSLFSVLVLTPKRL